jgi:hypothetical protein
MMLTSSPHHVATGVVVGATVGGIVVFVLFGAGIALFFYVKCRSPLIEPVVAAVESKLTVCPPVTHTIFTRSYQR